jgi:DNA mismatch endonuclease (patch repair protein)
MHEGGNVVADVHTPEQRSYNMSRIRGKNTKPEELVRRYLFAQGFRYRKNDARFPGKPDIVLPKYKTVIFVNGCFWHAHEGCKYFVWPKSNVDFWKRKINGNIQRDLRNNQLLSEQGWNVIVIWECQLKKSTFDETMQHLVGQIKNPPQP